MFSGQFKVSQIMIKLGRRPTAGTVTSFTGGAETPVVWFIFGMAVDALRRGVLQVRDCSGAEMAVYAFHILMHTGKLKLSKVVNETGVDRLDAIMAGQAIIPIRDHMRRNERTGFLIVTGDACCGIKRCVISIMAICAYGIRVGGK